jgi:hypothetical protein
MPVLDLFGIKLCVNSYFLHRNPPQPNPDSALNAIEWSIAPNSIDIDEDRAFQCRPDSLAIESKAKKVYNLRDS